jgi:hypothetical protein
MNVKNQSVLFCTNKDIGFAEATALAGYEKRKIICFVFHI